MSKKAIITEVKKNDYTDKYGNSSANIKFDNGDEGLITFKPDNEPVQGQEFEYEIEQKVSAKGNAWNKISRPKKDFKPGGGGKYNSVGQVVGMALNNATLAYCHGKIGDEDIANFADRIIKAAKALQDRYNGQF